MALPGNVGHGTVIGHLVDTNGTFIEGAVTFTPSPKKLLNVSAIPPATILPKPITAALVEGSFSQVLVATDDLDNNPQGWTYRVDFKLTGAVAESFSIEVPENSTVDITTVSPVPAANGTLYAKVLPSGGTEGQVLTIVAGEPTWGAGSGGGGTALTSYATQVATLTDYPTEFPPDLTGVTPATIGAQPAGSYATAAQGAKADAAVQPGALAPYAKTADLPAAPTWGTISGKPAVVAAGTSETAARDAIGAGTSNLQLGTGPTTAAAGNHNHNGVYQPAGSYATATQGAKADSAVQSANTSITGIEYYASTAALPATGTTGVLYVVPAEA